jgi:hypothetical protein
MAGGVDIAHEFMSNRVTRLFTKDRVAFVGGFVELAAL